MWPLKCQLAIVCWEEKATTINLCKRGETIEQAAEGVISTNMYKIGLQASGRKQGEKSVVQAEGRKSSNDQPV